MNFIAQDKFVYVLSITGNWRDAYGPRDILTRSPGAI